MIIKVQFIDPESSGKEELSRGTHGSPRKGEIEYILPLIWGQLEKRGGYQGGEMGWRERVKGQMTETGELCGGGNVKTQCHGNFLEYESDPSGDFW